MEKTYWFLLVGPAEDFTRLGQVSSPILGVLGPYASAAERDVARAYMLTHPTQGATLLEFEGNSFSI